MLLQFFVTFSNKILLLNVFLPISNSFLGQNYLDKTVFDNVNRVNHSSPMNNTLRNKTKHLPQLFALDPQIAIKRK